MVIVHSAFLEHSSVPDVSSHPESITDLLCDLGQFTQTLRIPFPSTEEPTPTSPSLPDSWELQTRWWVRKSLVK